ncbi:bacitracin ABC transporter ATP-binding protein [Flavihumibacter solisilvae]|uniref:Bacitracin ABC transporter ATP-binding protein n=2 Tax=Flavihumibacter solisilvae TaxID=1349421 RepID=A0A0C1LGW3_9BACT|nr:bacitracin ABC transporter ATP-binding protein [Flavihumibacter solisilvae]
MNMPVIEVRNLTKKFDDIVAVDELSFTVNAADVYGFLGQNGAGKSTTLRMLLSLIFPDHGDMHIFGMDLKHNRREILQQTGAVIERPDLYKYLTAYETLSVFSTMSGIRADRKRIMSQLELVGLTDRAEGKVRTFSQGMKQRLGIAVALIHDPRLVILDEPTNGLDPQGIADMRNLILHLSREMGKTVLVSSHLLSEIEQVATRMLIIDKGRKMVEGSVEALCRPALKRVEIDLADPVRAKEILTKAGYDIETAPGNHSRLVLGIREEEVPVVNRLLVQNDIDVISIRPANSLEEYFLSLTAGKQHVEAYKY